MPAPSSGKDGGRAAAAAAASHAARPHTDTTSVPAGCGAAGAPEKGAQLVHRKATGAVRTSRNTSMPATIAVAAGKHAHLPGVRICRHLILLLLLIVTLVVLLVLL
jgi:hypothetical protein